MSSGVGATGGRGRCYPFFEDFERCMAKARGGAPRPARGDALCAHSRPVATPRPRAGPTAHEQAVLPQECSVLRQDYVECLHHRQEFSRLNAMQEPRDARDASGTHQPRNPASVKF